MGMSKASAHTPSWFELTRERKEKGKTTVEVAYGITSLGPEEADAAALLGLVRQHWRIENCLHWVRDVTLGEDACRVRGVDQDEHDDAEPDQER